MGAGQAKQLTTPPPNGSHSVEGERAGENPLTFMHRLVEKHLDSLMDGDLRGTSNPTRPENLNPQSEIRGSSREATELIRELQIKFERSIEPLLYLLVVVANQIRSTEESQSVNLVFERISGLLVDGDGGGSCEGFVSTVLEGLLRRQDGEFVPELGREPVYCGLKVFLSGRSLDVSFDDILKCFWTDWLDTDCHWCDKPFTASAPPIRTIAAFETTAGSAQEIRIRVYNRHSSCMKPSGARYVPISHVWGPAIREAHASKQFSPEAASTVVSAIDVLLKSSKRCFEDGIEFWHDYISVPQWNMQLQQALLLILPSIYSAASEILVDLHDVATRYVAEILIEANRDWNNPLYQSLKVMVPLRALHNSQWMERMWVTLEYSRSQTACVMDESGFIWRTKEDETFFSRDSFTELSQAAKVVLRRMKPYAPGFSHDIEETSSLGSLIFRVEHTPSLGEAIELLRAKKCQYDRDRFLAAHVMATSSVQPEYSASVPPGAMEAYVWVQYAALLRGDYSPLMFHPLDRTEPTPSAGTPSWILDSQGLGKMGFELGVEIFHPDLPIKSAIVDGSSVGVPMDSAGVIQDIQYLDMECTSMAVVDRAILLLTTKIDSEGGQLSLEMLIDSLNGIFPLLFTPAMLQNVSSTLEALEVTPELTSQNVWNIGLGRVTTSFRELRKRDAGHIGRFEEQIARYTSAQGGPPGQSQRDSAVAEIADILELNREVSTGLGRPITRLNTSAGIVEQRRRQGETKGEAICRITCPECSTSFWLRLDLRMEARIGAKVYRIVGLTYAASVENCVGLVIQDGVIVGRMLYGIPNCGCQVHEVVQIK